MWVVDPKLTDAFDLAKAWGFPTFVTVLFRWLKSANGQLRLFDPGERLNYGLGYHTRGAAARNAGCSSVGRACQFSATTYARNFTATSASTQENRMKWLVGW